VTNEDIVARGRLAAALTLAAGCYGVAITAWYGTQFGGGFAYAIYAESIVVSALLFVLLRAYCKSGRRSLSVLAATIATLFFVWSVLGALSLAAGAFPAACLLVAAVALTPRGQPSPERSVSCSASRLV
jgi:hypothetical protein